MPAKNRIKVYIEIRKKIFEDKQLEGTYALSQSPTGYRHTRKWLMQLSVENGVSQVFSGKF